MNETWQAIALDALDRIATGRDICCNYVYDPTPTEREVAQKALDKIRQILLEEQEIEDGDILFDEFGSH